MSRERRLDARTARAIRDSPHAEAEPDSAAGTDTDAALEAVVAEAAATQQFRTAAAWMAWVQLAVRVVGGRGEAACRLRWKEPNRRLRQ